jgi:hypothetical protein
MIRPDIDHLGFTIAVVTCDECDHETSVKAQHNRHRGNTGKRTVIDSQVITKLTAKGWTNIKKTLRCPACEAVRVNNQTKVEPMETDMTETTTELRQPTREQKRQIMEILNEVYDTTATRYTGGETDKTVADAIGNGVMHGWVAQLREEFYGPEGGNEELEALTAEAKQWQTDATTFAKKCHDDIQTALASLREYNKLRDKLGDLVTRADKLKKAIGPKAEHI